MLRKEHFVSRRKFLKSSAATIAASSLGARASLPTIATDSTRPSHVTAGAIRWDAWYKRADSSIAAQHSLSSEKFNSRAPFFCSVASDFQIDCVGSAAEMDAEILSAVKGGLKYWAFDWYADDTSLRSAWTLYRQSASRDLINWCGMVGLDHLGSLPFSNNDWQANMREWREYMREPNYQKVRIGTANRPLLYILWDQSQVKSYFDDDLRNVRKGLDFLRQLLADLSVGAPYVVIVDGTDGAPLVREIGADAITNYISAFRHEVKGPYVDLDKQTREYWDKLKSTGEQIIPIAMVGWDTRARQERPVPWEHETPNPNPTLYYELPSPSELADHIRAAVEFIHSHPSACPSEVLLIYSWDECDEGGGLIPTLGDPKGSYLSAIAPIIT